MELSPQVQARLEQIAKLPRQVRMAILFGIAVAVAGAYYFAVYQGAAQSLRELQARELELQRKLSEVRSVAANLDAFEEEIAGLEQQLGEVLRQLPNTKELEVLLTDISNLGKTAGVEVKSFKRNDELVHDFYAEVPISIVLEGGYHDMARFFDLMSKLPRIVNVGSMTMKVSSDSADETRIRVSGTATTFRFVGEKSEKNEKNEKKA
jgi:type IV pilus assembly protein PilO